MYIIVLYDTAVRSTEDVHVSGPHTYIPVRTCIRVGFTATGSLVLTLPTDDTLVTIRKKVINRIVCLADGNEIPDILYITRPNNGAHI